MFSFTIPVTLGAMRHTRWMAKIALVLTASGGLMVPMVAPQARADEWPTQEVVGGWIGVLPCLITSAKPTSSSPTTVPFECVSGTTFNGSWTGHTVYRLSGTLDLLTGDLHGFVDETLVGIVTSTRAAGTLHLAGRLAVDGATSTVVVRERILAGTGAFLGSSGIVEFVGLGVGGVGQGGYHGTWTHS
jgi:hypothetical protein